MVNDNGVISWRRVLLRVNIPVFIAGHVVHRGTEFLGAPGDAPIYKLFGELEPISYPRTCGIKRMDAQSQAWFLQDPDTGVVTGMQTSQPLVAVYEGDCTAHMRQPIAVSEVNKTPGMEGLVVIC